VPLVLCGKTRTYSGPAQTLIPALKCIRCDRLAFGQNLFLHNAYLLTYIVVCMGLIHAVSPATVPQFKGFPEDSLKQCNPFNAILSWEGGGGGGSMKKSKCCQFSWLRWVYNDSHVSGQKFMHIQNSEQVCCLVRETYPKFQFSAHFPVGATRGQCNNVSSQIVHVEQVHNAQLTEHQTKTLNMLSRFELACPAFNRTGCSHPE
jgi:hypothetical protein